MEDLFLPFAQPTRDSTYWWEALRQRRLVLQHCTQCRTVRQWPRPMCSVCHSMDYTWSEACGHATVHSWTVAHYAFHPAMKADLPFAIVTADLAEGVRLLARFDGDIEQLAIGLDLKVGFETRGDGVTLPIFAPNLVSYA